MINKIIHGIWLCVTQLPDNKLREPIRQLIQIYNDDYLAKQRFLDKLDKLLTEIDEERNHVQEKEE
jgi:hypothetical protein